MWLPKRHSNTQSVRFQLADSPYEHGSPINGTFIAKVSAICFPCRVRVRLPHLSRSIDWSNFVQGTPMSKSLVSDLPRGTLSAEDSNSVREKGVIVEASVAGKSLGIEF